MLGEFELAEAIWDVAAPCLSAQSWEEMNAALRTSEPIPAICVALRALTSIDQPLPSDVFAELRLWLSAVPPLKETDRWLSAWLEVHVLASEVRSVPSITPLGGYGDATTCHLIVGEAGVADSAPHHDQAAAIRRWLSWNRPSPALRADIRASGFGYLLDEPK